MIRALTSLIAFMRAPEGTYKIRSGRIINLREHRNTILGWGYAAAAVVTFGYGVSHHPTCHYFVNEERPPLDTPSTAVKNGIGGVLWPLYWTWEIADRLAGRTPEPSKC